MKLSPPLKSGLRKKDGRWQALVFDAEATIVFACDHGHNEWGQAKECGEEWAKAPVQEEQSRE